MSSGPAWGPASLGLEPCVAHEEASAVVVESEPPRAALAERHGGRAVDPYAPRARAPRRVQPALTEEEQPRLAPEAPRAERREPGWG